MGFFIRFAEVLVRCLCFHFSPYVIRAVSENHFEPASWAGYKKAMGALPPNPLENNKDSNPPCCPRSANNREERMGAIRPQTPNQEQCPWTRSILTHRALDTMEPGQLRASLIFSCLPPRYNGYCGWQFLWRHISGSRLCWGRRYPATGPVNRITQRDAATR